MTPRISNFNEKCHVSNIFIIFSQQIICSKLLLILIWTYHLIFFFFLLVFASSNNLPLKFYCENIIVAFLSFNFLFFILFFSLSLFLLSTHLFIFFSSFFLLHTHILYLLSIFTFEFSFCFSSLPDYNFFSIFQNIPKAKSSHSFFLSLSLTHIVAHTHKDRWRMTKAREATF